jgi:tRNA (cmo5U34)-methyltransferase
LRGKAHQHAEGGIRRNCLSLWNEDLLHQEGFASVDCFWRHLNFAGWVAIKP